MLLDSINNAEGSLKISPRSIQHASGAVSMKENNFIEFVLLKLSVISVYY